MAQGQLAYIYPVGTGPSGPTDPGYGVTPPGVPPDVINGGPIIPPPLPGIWPPPGQISPPIHIPPTRPGHVSPPIYITEGPENPIALPPNTIWPPLPPETGISGKVAILIWVIGVGYRWFVYDPSVSASPPIAGTPSPK